MFGKAIWCFMDHKVSTYRHSLMKIPEQNFFTVMLLWKFYKHQNFCIPFYMNYFLTDLCLPVCFFFSSDSLDWILIAWWFQFLSLMLLVAWFLCLFHLNSCKSTSCLKMLLLCFSKTTQEKKKNVFFPPLSCLPPLGSMLPEHPCYILLCVDQWCCEWLMLALWWHQQPTTLFFFFKCK